SRRTAAGRRRAKVSNVLDTRALLSEMRLGAGAGHGAPAAVALSRAQPGPARSGAPTRAARGWGGGGKAESGRGGGEPGQLRVGFPGDRDDEVGHLVGTSSMVSRKPPTPGRSTRRPRRGARHGSRPGTRRRAGPAMPGTAAGSAISAGVSY